MLHHPSLFILIVIQMAEKRKRDDLMKIVPNSPNWEFLRMIREYRTTVNFRPLRLIDDVKENRICVCVRKRPLSKKEIAGSEIEVCKILLSCLSIKMLFLQVITIPTKDQIICHQPQQKVDLTKYVVE